MAINGMAVRNLRMQARLSQDELANALGVSRETVGRLERSRRTIDRRSELALLYIAEHGPLQATSLPKLHSDISQIVDEALVRGRVTYHGTERLRHAAQVWRTIDSEEGADRILSQLQGLIGLLNCTPDGDPVRDKYFGELVSAKQAWQRVECRQ